MLPLAVGKMSQKFARFPLVEQGGHRYPTPTYLTVSSRGTSDSATFPERFVLERRQPQEQTNPDRAGSPYNIGLPGQAATSSARRPMRRTTTAGTFLAISHRVLPLAISKRGGIGPGTQRLVMACAEAKAVSCGGAEDEEGRKFAVGIYMASIRRLWSCCLNQALPLCTSSIRHQGVPALSQHTRRQQGAQGRRARQQGSRRKTI